jgi:quercetin dioxygenase-like cupin family protein
MVQVELQRISPLQMGRSFAQNFAAFLESDGFAKMLVKQIDTSLMRTEYGVDVCRFLPFLPKNISPNFGASFVEVPPRSMVSPHSHHEHEMWFITAGQGCFEAGENSTIIGKECLLYMEPNLRHTVRNLSETDSLKFLSIWWD